MAGGTPGNSQISNSIMPTQNNRLQQQRMPQQQSGTIGGIGTDMGMGTGMRDMVSISSSSSFGGAPKTPTQQPGGWGNNYWGSNGGSTQPQTGGGYPPQSGQTPGYGGSQPAYQPSLSPSLDWRFQPGGGGPQAPLDLWAIAGGQQQYPQGQQQQQEQGPLPPWYQPGTPAPRPTYDTGGGYTPPGVSLETWMGMNNDGGQQDSMNRWNQMVLPWAQFSQNNTQWGSEFDEAQRRFDISTALQHGNDQAAQQIARDQFGLSAEQARIANEQWKEQMGWTQRNDIFNQGLATREQEEAERAARAQEGLGQGRLDLDRTLGMGQLDIGRGRLDLDRTLGMGQLDLDRTLGMGRLDLDRTLGQGQLDIGRGRLDLDRTLGMGQLDLDRTLGQGNLDARLRENQTALQLGQANIGLGHSELQMRNRIAQLEQSGMDRRTAQEIASRERISSGEQAGLDRRQTEALAAQERMATMQNYGRAMAPGAKWIRNW